MLKNRTSLSVALGNFLFHYRNALFPAYIITLVLLARPLPTLAWDGPPTFICKVVGLFAVLAGELIRLVTIGFEYIERGGRNRRVYASRLVTAGLFGHVRNPMYVGNIFIVAGLSVLTASPAATFLSVAIFFLVYRLIIAAEEDFLGREFGTEFRQYCRSVRRFVPRLSGLRETLSGMTFQWRRALRKDYGNLAMIGFLLTFLPLWKRFFYTSAHRFVYFREGHVLHENMETAGWYLAMIGISYLTVWTLKKRGRLADM